MKNSAHWMTDDPEVASRLVEADEAYDAAKRRAGNLMPAEKAAALKLASDIRADAYKRIFDTVKST